MMKPEKWSKSQIEGLIDAFKEEPCLYACNSMYYHNKQLRGEAQKRIVTKMLKLRPTTTSDECQRKIKNLRNQFTIENAKVKASLRSGSGTDDVYKPNLWYFSLLAFLDSFVKPRKNRNSLEGATQRPVSPNPSISCSDVERNEIELEPDVRPSTSSDALQESPADDTIPPLTSALFDTPSAKRPALSTSNSRIGQRWTKKRNRRESSDDDLARAINNLAVSLSQPIVDISTTLNTSEDPVVDGFLTFTGAMLKSLEDEELRLEVMNTITQTIINAKSCDIQRTKK